MKTVKNHIQYIVLLCMLLAGCRHTNHQDLVAVEETQSYHLAQCGKITMAKATAISREEAIRKQLHPCPYCKPDETL